MTKKAAAVPFQHLVVDSGPIILNSFPTTLAEKYYTVPEVQDEIKDTATKERMKQLPYILEFRNPSPDALKAVREFAKATGDLASLSPADLKVIALTLTLEKQMNGAKSRARLDPSEIIVNQGGGGKSSDTKGKVKPEKEKPSLEKSTLNSVPAKDDDDEDDGEWITPENIELVKAKAAATDCLELKEEEDDGLIRVGCISTDFAVQNLLLQMRLNLYGPEGFRIRQLKNWLLRCHACYWTTKQMDRRFCDRCGNNTLLRASYKVDSQGQTHIFLKKDFQHNLRGTNAALPAPKFGRLGNQTLLREDQKEYKQAMKVYNRQVKTAMAECDLNSIDDRLATIFGGMNIRGANKGPSSPVLPTIGLLPGRRRKAQ